MGRTCTSTLVIFSGLERLTVPSMAAPCPYTGRLTLSSCSVKRRRTPPLRDCFTKSPVGRGRRPLSAIRCSNAWGSAEYEGMRVKLGDT